MPHVDRRKATEIRATGELYPALQSAYDRFNRTLFCDVLPPCLITLHRQQSTLGYFSPERFVRYDGQITHEIALNPAYFATRTVKDTLSTLVHEFVHLWQWAIGTPSRSGYHNKEWASMCEAIGLMPSATGAPGGAKLGERMDHYIMPGKLFDRAADELIAEGFMLPWVDRFPAEIPRGTEIPPGYHPLSDREIRSLEKSLDDQDTIALVAEVLDEGQGAGTWQPAAVSAPVVTKPQVPFIVPRLPDSSLAGAASSIAWPSDGRAKTTRSKYRCHGCRLQAWAKPGVDTLYCKACERYMLEDMDRSRRHPRQR